MLSPGLEHASGIPGPHPDQHRAAEQLRQRPARRRGGAARRRHCGKRQVAADGSGESRDGQFQCGLHDDRPAPAANFDFRHRNHGGQQSSGNTPTDCRSSFGRDGGA